MRLVGRILRRAYVVGGAILVAGVFAWVAIRRIGDRPEPSILLVTIDTLRADRLGCYGYREARTPNLDRLASDGIVFERCFSAAPLTRPSHATLLCGVEPYGHGIRDNLIGTLPPQVSTLAERLAGLVPARGAVVASDPLVSASGLDRGFDSYDDELPEISRSLGIHFRERKASVVTDRALGWLADHEGERFFLWVHYFDPHAPYEPPAEFRSPGRDAYDGEVSYVDREIGRLLDRLSDGDRLDETIVSVTADHGEGFGEHGEETHGYFLYDSTLRVPWIVRYPERIGGARRVGEVVRLVDVAPTLLDLAGAGGERCRAFDGRSVLAERELRDSGAPPAYAETFEPASAFAWRPLFALRNDEWKLIQGGPRQREMYRIGEDRAELADLAVTGDPRACAAVASFEDDLASRASARPVPARMSREAREESLVLGSNPYHMFLETPEGFQGHAPPADPAAFIRALHRDVLEAALQGKFAGALAALERLRECDPENPHLALLEGRLASETGDPTRASRAFDRLRQLRPSDPRGVRGAVSSRIEAAEWKDAIRLCLELLETPANHELAPFLLRNMGYALLRSGTPQDAAGALERSLASDPESVETRIYLAYAYLAGGRLEDAAKFARDCVRARPSDPQVANLVSAVVAEGERLGEEAIVRKYLR